MVTNAETLKLLAFLNALNANTPKEHQAEAWKIYLNDPQTGIPDADYQLWRTALPAAVQAWETTGTWKALTPKFLVTAAKTLQNNRITAWERLYGHIENHIPDHLETPQDRQKWLKTARKSILTGHPTPTETNQPKNQITNQKTIENTKKAE